MKNFWKLCWEDYDMASIEKRLEQILPKIKEESFMESKGLGNEIGFYIFDYDPEHEMIVRDHISFLKDKINNNTRPIEIMEFDLYEIIINVIIEKGYFDKTVDMEKQQGSNKVLKAIKKMLRLTSDKNVIVNKISNKVEQNDIIFLTGVGKAWPIVRSHVVLNNLHPVIEDNPLVLFFPGKYDGSELKLFNEIEDDHYYRAFSLVPR